MSLDMAESHCGAKCLCEICRRQGALHWTAASQAPLLEFWTLLRDTMARLGDGYVAVGADEMARLAAETMQSATV